MPPLNEANVLGLEIERVSPLMEPAFDREDTWLATLQKGEAEKISSRDMRVPMELRPNGNSGHWDPNGGDMGRGDGPVFDKAVVGAVHFIHRVEWTAQSDMSTNTSEKAVKSAFRKLLADQLDDFRRNLDSFCMTAGSGVLATSSAVAIGTGTSGADIWTLSVSGDGFNARLLRFNMTVGVYNSTLATKRGEAKVNFYDEENQIVHLYPSIPAAIAGDKLVISGLGTSPTSIFGVPYHHTNSSSGTWLGYTRSATPEIRANRINASSSSLALPFPRRAVNKIGMRVGRSVMKKQKLQAWAHPCQAQAYEEIGQLVSVIQKGAKEESLNLYFDDNMQLAGAPLNLHDSWDKTRIDFVASALWGRAELQKIDFYADKDGRKIFPVYGQSGGLAAAWIMYYIYDFNIYHKKPAAGSYIDGLTIPTGY